MINLIMKDMKLQKLGIRSILIGIALLVFTAGRSIRLDMINGVLIPLIIYSYAMVSITYDNFYNTEKAILSMPVKRSEVVISKYIGVVIASIGAVIVTVLANYLIYVKLKVDFFEIWKGYRVFKIVVLSMIGLNIMIPVNLKFGLIKGKIITVMLIGASVVVYLIGFQNSSINLGGIEEKTIQIGIVLGYAVTLFGSYIISLKMYNRREF